MAIYSEHQDVFSWDCDVLEGDKGGRRFDWGGTCTEVKAKQHAAKMKKGQDQMVNNNGKVCLFTHPLPLNR